MLSSAGPNTPATTTSDTLRTPSNSPNSSPRSPHSSQAFTPSGATTFCRPSARRSRQTWGNPSALLAAAVAAEGVAPELKEGTKMLYKTTLCPWFARGRCYAKQNCNYAHSEEERRSKPDLRETRLCQTFMRRGRCDIGGCTFAHGYENLRNTVVEEAEAKHEEKGREEKRSKQFPTNYASSKSVCGGCNSSHTGALPELSVFDQWLRAVAREQGVHKAAKQMESMYQTQLEDCGANRKKRNGKSSGGGTAVVPRFMSFFDLFSFDDLRKACPPAYYD
eukprot:GHVS01079928.1.p1 GENE.GHVS01079928.1~~GHVS01079928.1.p1  ORF type:complete len:278 (+),score=59.43 GHVS01079928.1:964-1797(+)